MARTKIKKLPKGKKLSKEEMKKVSGGTDMTSRLLAVRGQPGAPSQRVEDGVVVAIIVILIA